MEREYEGDSAFLFDLNRSKCLTWALLLVYYQIWIARTNRERKNEWFPFGTRKQESFEICLNYRAFQKFVPIVNYILRVEFNASLGKCKLIQVEKLSKESFKAISN